MLDAPSDPAPLRQESQGRCAVTVAGQARDYAVGTEPEPFQRIAPDGSLTGKPDVMIDPAVCRSLYRDMVLARRLDQEANNLQRQGELALWLSCLGQEAAQVGSIRAMRDTDYVFPSYREHAAALCRGLSPGQILAQWRGVSHGGWDPAACRFHINSLVLATQTLHATGYAMGVRAEQSDEVVLVYLGDGASSQGDASEALNWAAVMNAPIIFFCQNNQWAISTPLSDQVRSPLYRRAAGFGLNSVLVDGNDVLAVHEVTRRAAAGVRAGQGPTFIEATTYRIAGHSTSDDPRRYRTDAELEHWRALDPLTRVERLLRNKQWLDDEQNDVLASDADSLAAHVREACLALEPLPLEQVFANTLCAETSLLRAEREQFTAYQESFL
jgi:2-oxoisovalerate dehydrogenase E1 component alpha subunit